MLRLVFKSRCIGLLRRVRRLFGSQPVDLDSVDELRTIGDCVDARELTRQLPADWQPTIEIVQFRGEPLAEVVRLTNQRDGTRLTLKPVDTGLPRGSLDIYRRPAPTAGRTHHGTEPSLSAGLTEAARLAESHSGNKAEADPFTGGRKPT